jgi:hypothetical protein
MVASIPVGVELFDVDPGVMMEYERKAVCWNCLGSQGENQVEIIDHCVGVGHGYIGEEM